MQARHFTPHPHTTTHDHTHHTPQHHTTTPTPPHPTPTLPHHHTTTPPHHHTTTPPHHHIHNLVRELTQMSAEIQLGAVHGRMRHRDACPATPLAGDLQRAHKRGSQLEREAQLSHVCTLTCAETRVVGGAWAMLDVEVELHACAREELRQLVQLCSDPTSVTNTHTLSARCRAGSFSFASHWKTILTSILILTRVAEARS